jgi:hypothetical protein
MHRFAEENPRAQPWTHLYVAAGWDTGSFNHLSDRALSYCARCFIDTHGQHYCAPNCGFRNVELFQMHHGEVARNIDGRNQYQLPRHYHHSEHSISNSGEYYEWGNSYQNHGRHERSEYRNSNSGEYYELE